MSNPKLPQTFLVKRTEKRQLKIFYETRKVIAKLDEETTKWERHLQSFHISLDLSPTNSPSVSHGGPRPSAQPPGGLRLEGPKLEFSLGNSVRPCQKINQEGLGM